MTDVYLAGYQGHRLQDLVRIAEHLEATVVDIRYVACSGDSQWHQFSLRSALGNFWYRHVPQWGNVNYNRPDQPIRIADFDGGLQALGRARLGRPMILLCRCPSPRGCHRSVIGASLTAIGGFDVRELDWQAGLIGSLFDAVTSEGCLSPDCKE